MEKALINTKADCLFSDDQQEGSRSIRIRLIKPHRENLIQIDFLPGKMRYEGLVISLETAEKFQKILSEKIEQLKEVSKE